MKLPLLAILLLSVVSQTVAQVAVSAEHRVQAVREEAVRIWSVQREKGNNAAILESNECRARLLKFKTTYDLEVEACLVVDYYVSFSTASFNESLSEEYRRANNIDAEKIRSDVRKRIASAYAFFKLTPAETAESASILREHVFPAVAAAASAKK
ncbi:hypothetical protein [Polaromonas sp. A23]|uniref:hypothetical protein n=1 Tax=Polaromonas sp. A23 TaxID=1944133 RepID=UPI000984FDAB|nr:hypothetical protein [Polaromonas sp. A23]OOG38417.1 hypothetical protein B0B52_16735 [Polaromonas sp. A23]